MSVKTKVHKEPSLFRKIIEVYFERAKRRKALWLLQKQEWSFDFLALLLVKASKLAGKNLSLVVTDKSGTKYTLLYDMAKNADSLNTLDDSIFNHLDDDIAIDSFIRNNSRR